MPNLTSPGLRAKPSSTPEAYLYLGFDELQFAQTTIDALSRRHRLGSYYRPGLLIDTLPDGTLGDQWLAVESSGEVVIGVSGTMTAIDSDGFPISAEAPYTPYDLTGVGRTLVAIPNDGVTRTLVLRRGVTTYAEGTITTDGSTAVVGTGTTFSDLVASTDSPRKHGTYIRVYTADEATVGAAAGIAGAGNRLPSGCFEITAIGSDTSITVTPAPPTSGGNDVPFSIVGSYFTTDGSTVTDPECQRRIYAHFALVTRTFQPAAGDIIIADVVKTAGVVTLTDRRKQSVAIPRRNVAPSSPKLKLKFDNDAATFTPEQGTFNALVTEVFGDFGPTSTALYGNNLVVALERAGDVKTCYQDVRKWGRSPEYGSLTTVQATASSPVLLVHSYMGVDTLLCLYIASNVVYKKASTDSGATWGASSVVWTPTAGDTISMIAATTLMDGRIYLVAAYESGGSTSVNAAVSTNPEATAWDTNSDDGYELTTPLPGGAITGLTVAQCPVTGYVWLGHSSYSGLGPVYLQPILGVFVTAPGLGTPTSLVSLTLQADSGAAGQYEGAFLHFTPAGRALFFYAMNGTNVGSFLKCSDVFLSDDATTLREGRHATLLLYATDNTADDAIKNPRLSGCDVNGELVLTGMLSYTATNESPLQYLVEV